MLKRLYSPCSLTFGMPEQFQTSFIPKKSVEGPTTEIKNGTDLFLLVAVILFILTLCAGAGVFLYEKYLIGAIVGKEESLKRAEAAFDLDLIRELSRLDQKLTVSEKLLKKHIAVSELFHLLEQQTLKSVRFGDLRYLVGSGGDIVLSMKGAARSFAAIALQSDVFGKSRFIKSPIFSDLDLDKNGNVTFSFTATVDPALLSYERLTSDRELSSQGVSPTTSSTSPVGGEQATSSLSQ